MWCVCVRTCSLTIVSLSYAHTVYYRLIFKIGRVTTDTVDSGTDNMLYWTENEFCGITQVT